MHSFGAISTDGASITEKQYLPKDQLMEVIVHVSVLDAAQTTSQNVRSVDVCEWEWRPSSLFTAPQLVVRIGAELICTQRDHRDG